MVAKVVILQSYKNAKNEVINADYHFPIDELGIVSEFEAFLGDVHLVGKVQEKKKAQQIFTKAVSEGSKAVLMNEDKDDPVRQ